LRKKYEETLLWRKAWMKERIFKNVKIERTIA